MNKRLVKIAVTSVFAVSSLFAVAAQATSVFAMNEGASGRTAAAEVRSQRALEAGDDRLRRASGEVGDDKGGMTAHVEPGDDKGGTTPHIEPGDDKGGGSGKSGHN